MTQQRLPDPYPGATGTSTEPEPEHATTAATEWLREFVTVTREEILREYPPRTCVLSCRIGRDVLAYHGLRPRPAPMKVTVYPSVTAFENAMNGSDEEVAIGVAGSGQVTDAPVGGRLWDGHLVLWLGARPRLIDLSADQFHRPDYGIAIPEPVVSDPFGPDSGAQTVPVVVLLPSGALLLYRPIDNRDWRADSSWDITSADIRRVIGRAIRRLRRPAAEVIAELSATPSAVTTQQD